MLNVKLSYLRLLNDEINRLEALREQMASCRDYEKKKEYYDDLAWCGKEKSRLLCEGLLDKLPLSSEEKVMARIYYYEGKTWEYAFKDMRDGLPYEKQKLYGVEEEKKEEEEEEEKEKEKKPNKNMVRLKKSITRKIQSTFNYYLKAKEN